MTTTEVRLFLEITTRQAQEIFMPRRELGWGSGKYAVRCSRESALGGG
jgi:hypothetical protein